jgi:outer membrane protein OmpA-like peptidoglycan-associated protein
MNMAWKFDFGGLFDQDQTAPSLQVPPAPTEIASAPASDSAINLTWSAVAKAVNYRVYRDGKYVASTPATRLTDAGLDGATDHCYHVRAVDAAGKESEPSKQTCTATLKPVKAVLGPLELTATAVSESQINLSWNSVPGALGYKVYRDGLYLMTSTAGTSVPDKELREAGRYCYQVTAVDTAGRESERSNQACAEGSEQVFAFKKTEAAATTSVAKEVLEKGRVRIDIEFDYNKYDVKPKYHDELKKIGDVMTAHPDLKMVIEGHTDNVGGKSYNMTLSTKRAEAVRTYIVEQFGVKKTHLTAKGYGMSRPVASNKTPAGRQKNRRVEAAVEYTIKK